MMQRPHQSTTFPVLAFSLVIGVLLVTFFSYLFTPASRLDCPVRVDGEDRTSSTQLSFSANPSNYQSYSWRVSAGEISGPKDTPSITVLNVATGSSCTATVTIRHNDCENSASHTTEVVPPACPALSISCPARVNEGESITFGANIPFHPALKFNWSLSAGEIKEGQGTPAINVKTAGFGGRRITARLLVAGSNCNNSASCETEVVARPKARRVDQLARIRWSEERSRLKSYATQLQNEADAQGYIVVYGNTDSEEDRKRLDRLKAQLVKELNIEAKRVIFVPKETDKSLTFELWIVPKGAPVPSFNDRP